MSHGAPPGLPELQADDAWITERRPDDQISVSQGCVGGTDRSCTKELSSPGLLKLSDPSFGHSLPMEGSVDSRLDLYLALEGIVPRSILGQLESTEVNGRLGQPLLDGLGGLLSPERYPLLGEASDRGCGCSGVGLRDPRCPGRGWRWDRRSPNEGPEVRICCLPLQKGRRRFLVHRWLWWQRWRC